MYISLNWLKDFVSLPRAITPEELGLRLTMHTVEIDGVEKQADKFENIIAGKILEVRPHPNADKLRLATVRVKDEDLPIVCGADNIEAGQMVPVALPGAVLPGGIEIKESEIRGEKSQGMLCAEDELGLGDDHSGIMILSDKAKPGQPLSGYLALDDVLFEVDNKSITNRPDLWGHYGIAREVAAFLDIKIDRKIESLSAANLDKEKDGQDIKVKVEDSGLCPRYMAAVIDDIKIKSSPEWLQKRLVAVGVRPINNIVDVTNYVMLELGQPLHAFDASGVDMIAVRPAQKNEEITTLDGKMHQLDESMLVIADSGKPIALAGVMGGQLNEVSDNTDSIILEAANFDPVSIRKTAQEIGSRTEASMRYEKSLDPNLCETALTRSVELIKQVCPEAKLSAQVVDAKDFSLDTGPIKLNTDWIRNFIGQQIDNETIRTILKKLGFFVESDNNDFSVTVPAWRATKDISVKEDLAEEIARIYGYNNIVPRMPKAEIKVPFRDAESKIERKIKDLLAGVPAMTEVHCYSFVGPERLQKLGADETHYLKLANPISAQHTMLKQSLFPNLLECARANQAKYENPCLFEIGRVYLNISGEIAKDPKSGDKLPYEEKRLGMIVAGADGQEAVDRIKGALEYVAGNFGVEIEFTQADAEVLPPWAEQSASAEVRINGRIYGFVYPMSKKTAKRAGIKKEAAAAEVVCTGLVDELAAALAGKHCRPLPKYPAAFRDLAFVVEENILYNDIKKEIVRFHEYIQNVFLFDVYRGEQTGKNKKNLAFHVQYQADKTLTTEEVNEIQEQLVKHLEEKFGAKVRDF